VERDCDFTIEKMFPALFLVLLGEGVQASYKIFQDVDRVSLFEVFILECNVYEHTGRIFTLLTGSTALRFTATGGPPAARRIRILPMNQDA
jgi:hypothetical protein